MPVVAVGWYWWRKIQHEVVELRQMTLSCECCASRWICGVMTVFAVIVGFVCYFGCCGRQMRSFDRSPAPR